MSSTAPVARPGSVHWTGLAWLQRAGNSVATTVLPFALVLYLALKGGGYDTVIRSEIGIAIWWLVLLGAIIGILPTASRPFGTTAWIGLGLLLAFAVWTTLGMTWSDSAERSATEAARMMTYLGVFTLALLAQGRDGLRQTVASIAAAIGVIGILAMLSRLHPSWFPANETAKFLPSTADRLSYPVNYWNGLATMMAMGIPLLLGVTSQSRSAIRALATATIPVLALTTFFTLSRGGLAEVAVAVLAFVVLSPQRMKALPYVMLASIGSALLIAAAAQRDLVEKAVASPAAQSQANEMLVIVAVVVAGVGFLAAAVTLATRAGVLRAPRISRRQATAGFATALLIGTVALLALGGPRAISNGWSHFKDDSTTGNDVERLGSVSGNGRYDLWRTAIHATNGTGHSILSGTGPGTFEYRHLQTQDGPGFERDAHSLYLETLGELGIVGLLLLVTFLIWPFYVGIRQLVRHSERAGPQTAAALAAMAAFLVAAAVDWAWELSVLPVTFLLLAAAIGMRSRSAERSAGKFGLRILVAGLAIAAVIGIGLPLGSTNDLRASQAAASANPPDLARALDDAQNAAKLQPYAATPRLQEALVLELQGRFREGATAARAATDREPTNWRTWFVLSRLQAEAGNSKAALATFGRASQLNPQSSLFSSYEQAKKDRR